MNKEEISTIFSYQFGNKQDTESCVQKLSTDIRCDRKLFVYDTAGLSQYAEAAEGSEA